MILLNQELLFLMEKVVNFAFTLRIIPFKWNSRKKAVGVVMAQYSKSKCYRWEVMISLYLIHQIYISIVFVDNLKHLNSLDIFNQTLIFAEAMYVLCFGFAFTGFVAIVDFKTYLPATINQFLTYFLHFQG